ncbi:kinase-like domain-containing protein [Mycena capillaripes]|nr:kinase-like domain-containing protein [Mycena capillaripes]
MLFTPNIQEDPTPDQIEECFEVLKAFFNLNLYFNLMGYEAQTVAVATWFVDSQLNSPTPLTPPSFPSVFPDTKKSVTVPTAFAPSPATSTIPTVKIEECIHLEATGAVYRGMLGLLPLIIKAIPPGCPGEDELNQEAIVYERLAALQGSVLPRLLGSYKGDNGWSVLVMEDCGSAVKDIDELSLEQCETLRQHAHTIHANGVTHRDLSLRNLVVSSRGDVRIIDFAYSRIGHECDGCCWESFQ